MKLTRVFRMKRNFLISLLLFPVFMGLAVDGGDGGDGGDPGGDDGGDGGTQADDLAALFTAEEIEGKKASIEAGKAEEARRAALSDEERKAEDDAKAEEAKKVKGAPEAYEDFKIPEGMESAKDVLDELKPILKDELNLSQEKAQKLIDFYTGKVLPHFQAKGIEVWNADIEKRQNEIKNDKEIGGEKLKASTEAVNRVVNSFLKPEESEALKEYSARFGDSPVLIKLLARVGNAMKEDGIVIVGAGGQGGSKSIAERLYGSKD